jgi:hypothetical protein
MMDFEIWKHRREEIVRQTERDNLTRALRRTRERRGREVGGLMIGQEDGGSRIRLGETEEGAYTTRAPTRPRSSYTTASCAWKGSVWEAGGAASASTGGRAR